MVRGRRHRIRRALRRATGSAPQSGWACTPTLVSGTRIDLAEELRDTERGLLLVWMAHTCPTSNHLLPEMRRLHDDYAPRGWRVFGICSNTGRGLSVPAEAWSERYRRLGIPFPVLDDRAQTYVRPFGLTVTPTFAVITREFGSGSGRLAYLGGIVGGKDRFPYLRNALDAVASGAPAPAIVSPYG